MGTGMWKAGNRGTIAMPVERHIHMTWDNTIHPFIAARIGGM